jgi:hypothetical protein
VQIDVNSGNAYVVVSSLAAVTGNNTIFYDASGVASTDSSASRAPLVSGQTPLDPDFDAAYIAVLSNLAAGDKIISAAGGVVTSAEIVSATPAAAKINGAFGGTAEVILSGAAAKLTGEVSVPASSTLTVKGVNVTLEGTIRLGANAVIDATTTAGSLIAGADTDKVTIDPATITAPAGGDTITGTAAGALTVPSSTIAIGTTGTVVAIGTGALTVGDAENHVTLKNATYTPTSTAPTIGNGAITMGATNTLDLLLDGVIETAGTGSLIAGATSFGGDGAWTVTALAGGGSSLRITSASTGATLTNQGSPSGTSAVLAASGTPLITQATGSTNALVLPLLLTIDLGGNATAAAGGIKLITGSNPGTISFPNGVTCIIKTGIVSGAAVSVGTSSVGIASTGAVGKLLVSGNNHLDVKALSASPNNLESITSTATGSVTLKAHTTGGDEVTINSLFGAAAS